MNFQSLSPAKKIISVYINQKSQSRLSTIYKHCRKLKQFELFGDWPLICEIVIQSAKQNKFFSSKEIIKTFRLSNDPELSKLRTSSELVLLFTDKNKLIDRISRQKE